MCHTVLNATDGCCARDAHKTYRNWIVKYIQVLQIRSRQTRHILHRHWCICVTHCLSPLLLGVCTFLGMQMWTYLWALFLCICFALASSRLKYNRCGKRRLCWMNSLTQHTHEMSLLHTPKRSSTISEFLRHCSPPRAQKTNIQHPIKLFFFLSIHTQLILTIFFYILYFIVPLRKEHNPNIRLKSKSYFPQFQIDRINWKSVTSFSANEALLCSMFICQYLSPRMVRDTNFMSQINRVQKKQLPTNDSKVDFSNNGKNDRKTLNLHTSHKLRD